MMEFKEFVEQSIKTITVAKFEELFPKSNIQLLLPVYGIEQYRS